jgi:hypothetical protein
MVQQKALIILLMTYACPAWELAADTYLLKLQRLQTKVPRTTGNYPRCTPIRDLQAAFNRPYAYDYITKSCSINMQRSNKIMRMNMFHGIGQCEARFKLSGGQAYDRSNG